MPNIPGIMYDGSDNKPSFHAKQRVQLDRSYLTGIDDQILEKILKDDRDPVGVIVAMSWIRSYCKVLVLGQYYPITVPIDACSPMNAKAFKQYLEEYDLDPEWANSWLKLAYQTIDNL